MEFREIIRAPFEKHANTFEKLIKAGKIKFSKSTKKALEPTGLAVAFNMLETSKIKWLLGDIGIHEKKGQAPSYILKLDHPVLCYVDIFPCREKFMWINKEDHSDSIHPNQASMYLFAAALGGEVTVHELLRETESEDLVTMIIRAKDHTGLKAKKRKVKKS